MEEKEKVEIDNDEMENEEEILEEDKSEEEDDKLKDSQEKEDLASKENEIEDLTNSLLRLKADFSNYKNRVEKEKISTIAYALEGFMCDLLPILDNFERAMDSCDEEDGFYEGVNMIYEQFVKVLGDNGLQEIECIGECFNPNLHHAVFTEESEDEEEGIILEVLQKGYLLNDKVIRPSMVKVAK